MSFKTKKRIREKEHRGQACQYSLDLSSNFVRRLFLIIDLKDKLFDGISPILYKMKDMPYIKASP